LVEISPATKAMPVVRIVSQATREYLSWARIASRIPSEIWSAILSGCPSVTDSFWLSKTVYVVFGQVSAVPATGSFL
jgi:hypothetical protein